MCGPPHLYGMISFLRADDGTREDWAARGRTLDGLVPSPIFYYGCQNAAIDQGPSGQRPG